MQGGEWKDLTIRAVTTDASGERAPRRPPTRRPDGTDEEDDAADVDLADTVRLGPEQAPSLEALELHAPRLKIAVIAVGVDMQTQWAVLVEAAAMEPALRFWGRGRSRLQCALWRPGRLPLGVPMTAAEAFISSQLER